MLTKYWEKFKSGTDIRGVASEGVPGEKVLLTDKAVRRIAGGFAFWLSERAGRPADTLIIALGHDPRLSAGRLREDVESALTKSGVRVLDCGLSSTPAMFQAVGGLGCDGSIQLTASHHPWNRNGLKFFTPGGGLSGSDIEAVLQCAQDGNIPGPAEGCVEKVSFMPRYCAGLREMIQKGVDAGDFAHPLRGFHIVVDAGNGAGSAPAGSGLPFE